MKRLKILMLTALVVLSGVNLSASGFDLGFKTCVYSRWDGMVGAGVSVNFPAMKMFRVESSLLFLTKKDAKYDWSNELQLPLYVSSALQLYPLVGFSINDPGEFGVALGLGGGMQYKLNDRWGLNGGLKWNLQSQSHINNPLLVSFGLVWRFRS